MSMKDKLFWNIPIRFSDSQLGRIDAAVKKYNKRTGMEIGRAAMVRYLVETGLKEEEKIDSQGTGS